LTDEEGGMRLPRLAAVGVASLGLAATPAGRIATVVGGAAVATSCGWCSIGTISPDTLPDGQVGKAYSFQLDVSTGSNCSQRLEFSRVAGGLPPGMQLSRDGVLDGTPTESGAYSFTVTATLLASGEYSRSFESAPKSYTLTILP
jgi:hypothetical protein